MSRRSAISSQLGGTRSPSSRSARSHPPGGARCRPLGDIWCRPFGYAWPRLIRGSGVTTLGFGLLFAGLAACDGGAPGPVSVTPPRPTGLSAAECAKLLEGLPNLVLEQEMREVDPADASTAAWGNPPVMLRCGVERPARLEASSPCFVANHVGWFADESNPAEVVFTTIGRSTYVEVTVPDEYPQPSGALAELASAVSNSTTQVQPCV